MSHYSSTLLELIERIGRLGVDEWYEGTATGGTTATLVDTLRYESNDFFNNLSPPTKVRITSTTDGLAPQGEERYITDWTQSTGTFVPHANFTVAPAAGDKYIATSKYTWEEFVEAINSALELVSLELIVERIDETIPLVAGVYDYPIPSDYIYIYAVSMSDGDGNFGDRIPPDQYRVVRGASSSMLHLIRLPETSKLDNQYVSEMWADSQIVSNRLIRIEGFIKPPKLVNPNDICEVSPEYIWRQAAALLRAKRVRSAQNDQDDNRAQYTILQNAANIERIQMLPQRPPDLKRIY